MFENLQKSRETLPRTFVDMLTLSWLVLLAFYGPEIGSRELLDFCQAQEHSAQALYLLSSHVTFGRRVPLSMTGRNCELCRQGLSKDEYVMDAASCLPQLTDAIRQGGKIAVTGMGGIGKTEMTRQALAVLAKEELFSRMAWVQYENSLRHPACAWRLTAWARRGGGERARNSTREAGSALSRADAAAD